MISYGQEGGGDAAAGAASILQAVGGIVTGVADVVYIGRMTESKVFTNVADYQDHFQNNLQDLNNIKRYIRRYKLWLADSGNLASWCSGTAATNHAPAGRKTCVELYDGKPARPNPGGHRCGSPACQCKTHPCAYRDPAKADSYKRYIEWASGPGGGAGWSNPPNRTGRGAEWRLGYLREAWNYLMTVAPAEPLWNAQNPSERISVATSMLVDPQVLETLYPELNGAMPVDMQDHWWNTIVTLNALNFPPYTTPESTVPYFVFGFTEEQVRTLFPDSTKRRAVFSIRFLVSLQREYTNQLLAQAGATDVFAGSHYGQDIPDAGASASDMRRLIEEAAATAGSVVTTSGQPSPGLKQKIATGQVRVKAVSAAGIDPFFAYRNKSTEELERLASSGNIFAQGALNQRRRSEQESLDNVIEPNYTPLVVGGASLLGAFFLRRLR